MNLNKYLLLLLIKAKKTPNSLYCLLLRIAISSDLYLDVSPNSRSGVGTGSGRLALERYSGTNGGGGKPEPGFIRRVTNARR